MPQACLEHRNFCLQLPVSWNCAMALTWLLPVSLSVSLGHAVPWSLWPLFPWLVFACPSLHPIFSQGFPMDWDRAVDRNRQELLSWKKQFSLFGLCTVLLSMEVLFLLLLRREAANTIHLTRFTIRYKYLAGTPCCINILAEKLAKSHLTTTREGEPVVE